MNTTKRKRERRDYLYVLGRLEGSDVAG